MLGGIDCHKHINAHALSKNGMRKFFIQQNREAKTLCHICPLPTTRHFFHLPTVRSTQTCWPRILCTLPSAFAKVTASLENAPFFPLWILAHLTKPTSEDTLSKGFLLCFTEQIFPKFLPGAGLRYKQGVCDQQKSQPLCQDARSREGGAGGGRGWWWAGLPLSSGPRLPSLTRGQLLRPAWCSLGTGSSQALRQVWKDAGPDWISSCATDNGSPFLCWVPWMKWGYQCFVGAWGLHQVCCISSSAGWFPQHSVWRVVMPDVHRCLTRHSLRFWVAEMLFWGCSEPPHSLCWAECWVQNRRSVKMR